MNQSTVLLNAAFILIKIVYNLMTRRAQSGGQSRTKALTHRAPKSLLPQADQSLNPLEGDLGGYRAPEEHQSLTVAGHYAYVQTATHLLIFNIEDKQHPMKVSESLLY